MRAASLLAVVAVLPAQATGQVGHDPSRSPYRDLTYGQFVTVTGGQLFGKGGKIGVGPHNGQIVLIRHDFLANRPVSLSLGGGLARVDRNYVDLPSLTNRIRGPLQHNVYFAEGVVQLNLTGGKSWHNLAPFLSLGLGLARAEKIAADTSKYSFGTKFYLAPAVGTRFFLSRRLFFKVEARTTFWNLSYPPTYRQDLDGPFAPGTPLFTDELKEWNPTPVLHAGFGFAFRRPFF